MAPDAKTDPKHGSSPVPGDRERSSYESPAISWEEKFEAVVALSCSLLPIQGGPCSVKAHA